MAKVELSLTRRQLLEALLSAPVAAAACKRSPPPHIPGSVRGPSMDIGHKLRGTLANALPGEVKHVEVAIVGGGPSGLSAAWRLSRLGMDDYAVFDLESRPGGTSTFGDDGIVPYPWGAHYVPLPSPRNRALVALLREIGAIEGVDAAGQLVAAEEQLVRAPDERLFYLDRWYDGLYLRAGASAEDLAELERFQREVARYVAMRDAHGRPAFALPLAQSSDDAELLALDRLSMADWLAARGFRSKRLLWYVDYACRDDYGLLCGDASAWAGLFYFASRAEDEKSAAPLLAWPEGNGRLVRHLGSVAGPRVKTSRLVVDLDEEVEKSDGVMVTVLDTEHDVLEKYHAKYVVFAAPKFTASRVIRRWREIPPEHLSSSLDYGAWMVANIHLSGRPASRGFPVAWDNVLYDSPSLGYVVATHQGLVDFGPTIWTYYYPLTEANGSDARKRLLSLDHHAWCDVILADLTRAHRDLAKFVERIDIYRWGHAMARPKVGHLFSGARARRAQPVGRIHFAHSDLSGMGLFEEAQYWGIAAAEAIAERCGRDVASLLG